MAGAAAARSAAVGADFRLWWRTELERQLAPARQALGEAGAAAAWAEGQAMTEEQAIAEALRE